MPFVRDFGLPELLIILVITNLVSLGILGIFLLNPAPQPPVSLPPPRQLL